MPPGPQHGGVLWIFGLFPHIAARTRRLDSIIARIASRQKGVVTRAQLLAAGLTRHEIQLRVDRGSLIPLHPGVYLVGHAGGSPLAHEAAAVLACAPRALLARRSAAQRWELPVKPGEEIELIVVGRRPSPRRGIRILYLNALPTWELRHRDGLPVTSPALTLLDLAAVLDTRGLADALNEARVGRIVTEAQLVASLRTHPLRTGAGALRKLLASELGSRITRSEAERRALALMRRHGLDPETDVEIGPWRADFLFRAEHVIVEVDGYRYHSTPKRFVDDRRRAADLTARGFVLFSLTWQDLGDDADAAMARLLRALEVRRAP